MSPPPRLRSFPLFALLTALLLAATAAAATDYTAQPYNITLTSASPLLAYSPNNTGSNGQTGWNVTYTDSPWSSPFSPTGGGGSGGQGQPPPSLSTAPVGNGSSVHWTNASSASVSFQFYGTAFAILGRVYSGRTELNIDGVTISTTASVTESVASMTSSAPPRPTSSEVSATGAPVPDDTRPVLGQAAGLAAAWHNVSITFYPLGQGGGQSGMEVYGVRQVMGNGQNG